VEVYHGVWVKGEEGKGVGLGFGEGVTVGGKGVEVAHGGTVKAEEG